LSRKHFRYKGESGIGLIGPRREETIPCQETSFVRWKCSFCKLKSFIRLLSPACQPLFQFSLNLFHSPSPRAPSPSSPSASFSPSLSLSTYLLDLPLNPAQQTSSFLSLWGRICNCSRSKSSCASSDPYQLEVMVTSWTSPRSGPKTSMRSIPCVFMPFGMHSWYSSVGWTSISSFAGLFPRPSNQLPPLVPSPLFRGYRKQPDCLLPLEGNVYSARALS